MSGVSSEAVRAADRAMVGRQAGIELYRLATLEIGLEAALDVLRREHAETGSCPICPRGGSVSPQPEQKVCADCGGPLFFNHHVASTTGGEWRYSHGDCEAAARVLDGLPAIYDMAIQANVEVAGMIARFMSERSDEEWGDPARLQRLLLDAYHAASEGVRSEARLREAGS